jgi:hypothetical protein
MRKSIVILFIVSILGMAAFGEVQVRLTLATAMDFMQLPDFQQVMDRFSDRVYGHFWGLGWEVIIDHLSIGGNYMASFLRDQYNFWDIDWLGEALYAGYHFFGPKCFVDPFMQVGLGSAGRVDLSSEIVSPYDRLYIAIYPFVGAGLNLNFDGFVVGAKLNYLPFVGPVPVTPIKEYPVKNFQIVLSAGVGIGPK